MGARRMVGSRRAGWYAVVTLAGPLALAGLLLAAPLAAQSQSPPPKPKTTGETEQATPNMQRLRQEWFHQQRAYPHERIPAGAWLRAVEQLDQMIKRDRELQLLSAPGTVPPPPPNMTTWTAIGPIPTNGTSTTHPTSGRIGALAVCPSDANTVFLGGAQGGIWKTTDAGVNWTPKTDDQPAQAIGSIAIAPSVANCQTIYVGTGEQHNSGDSYYGVGILKSTDGGDTWALVAPASQFRASPFCGFSSSFCGGPRIGGLAVKPDDANTVLAAVQAFTNSPGVFRSTDGGMNFARVLPTVASGQLAQGTSVVFNPTNPLIAYAAITQAEFTGGTSGVYRSVDGGAMWALRNGTGMNVLPTGSELGRIELTISPSSPDTIYAAIQFAGTGNLHGVFKTTDGGVNWTRTNAPDVCTAQCAYDLAIAVHPSNANLVVYGGAANTGYISRTTDGGANWASIIPAAGTRPHVDIHALGFAADGSKLYAGTDGGIYSSANAPNSATAAASVTWTNLNAPLNLTQFYPGHAILPSDVNIGFGGTQDNGNMKYTGDLSWDFAFFFGCDSGYNALNATGSPFTVLGTCQYVPDFILEIERSTTDGNPGSWVSIACFFSGFCDATNGINRSDPGEFIPPLVNDPSTPARVYFGTNRVYRHSNNGDTGTPWEGLGAAGGTDLGGNGADDVTAIAVAPSNSNTVYAGTSNGRVCVTGNATAVASTVAWTCGTTGLPLRSVSSVAVDPTNLMIAYVTFSGFTFGADTLGHVFMTTNGGGNWTDISGTGMGALPNTPVNDIIIDPSLANTLYVATDVGVFRTTDGGTTWSVLGMGLPKVSVFAIRLHQASRTLRAATHGRGMWDLSVPTVINNVPVAANDPLYVTGPNQQLVINDGCPDGPFPSTINDLLCNDTDADMDPLTVVTGTVTTPANGTVMVNANGSFTYTPDLGFSGPDTFTYQVTDGTANSNFATVTITVNQCTRVFDNDSADNQFETTTNWNPDGVPGSGTNEVLCIGGAFPVTHFTGTETIFSLRHTSTLPLTFTGGTLTLDSDSEIGAGGLVLTSGTIDVDTSSSLNVNGPMDWQAGTLAGGGNVEFMGGATLSTAGDKTVTGGTVVFNPIGRTLSWTDGEIRLNAGSALVNEGTFNATNDDVVTATSGSGTFQNSSVLNKAGGGLTTRVGPDVTFNNLGTGTVNVNAGTFNIGGSGSSTGDFNVAMNSFLEFGGIGAPATFNFNSGSSVTGAGTTVLAGNTGDTTNFNAGSSLSTAVGMGDGTLNLTTGSTVSIPSLDFGNAGILNANNALNIGAGGLVWSCGTFGGTQTVTLSGPGTLNDTACGDKILAGGNFVNTITITWTGGNIQFNSATAQLTINENFEIQTDTDITNGGAGGAIVNNDTFRKQASAGTTDVAAGISFTQSNGFLVAQSGTLSFGSTVTINGGTVTTNANLSGTTFDLNGGSLTGAGTISGTVNNNGAVAAPGFSTGTINLVGTYNQAALSAYNVEIGAVGDNDQLVITGNANLDGTLNAFLINAFTPSVGDMFTILTAGIARNGQFATLNLPSVAPNEWQVQFNANDVTLVLLANAPPVANPDMYSTNEEVQLVVNAASGVLANDTDSSAMTVTTTPVMDVSNGTLVLNADGSFTYTPDVDFAGMDSFVYEVCDTEPLCSTATVTITVNGINDAPTFSNMGDVSAGEDVGMLIVPGWATNIVPGPATATDEAAQVLTFSVTGNTNPALFSVQPAVDVVTGTLTFTVTANANGTSTITLVLMDDGGTANGGQDTSAPAVFTITINPMNDTPVANDDGPFTVVQNSMNNALDVLANDTDVDMDTLMVTQITMAATNGTATANGTNVLYTPNVGFTGMDSFTYEACDPSAACDTAVVTVDVIANLPPNAVDDVANTNEDSFVDTNVLSNDDDGGDGGALSVVGFTQPANGAVTDQGGGVLRYTPNPDFNGMDSFTYDVSDTFITDTGTVNVTVVAVNDAPSFTDAGDVTVAEDSGAQTVAGWATNIVPGPMTATDEAGQTLQFNVTGNTNSALFSVQPAVNATSGDLTFTPAPDAFGSSDITVVLMDNGGTANGGVDTSASSTFTITVTNVNDPPVITAGPTSNPASPIPGNTATGASVAFSITASDPDGDALTFAWSGGCGASSVEDPTLACPFGMGLSVDVTVSDPSMATDMGNIVVDVTDYSLAAACQGGTPPCNSATMATIAAGQAVDFNLTATGINGTYAANITYSCMNLPAFTTCTFTPSASVANAPPGGVVTMLRIQTTAPGFAQLHAPASQQSQPPFLALFMTVPGLALFGLVLAGGRRKRRSLGTLCLLAIVLVMATVLVGCGSGGDFFASVGSPGTPTGSHAITINAQGTGTLSHSVNLTVVVQ